MIEMANFVIVDNYKQYDKKRAGQPDNLEIK